MGIGGMGSDFWIYYQNDVLLGMFQLLKSKLVHYYASILQLMSPPATYFLHLWLKLY